MRSVKLGFFALVLAVVQHAAAQQTIFTPPAGSRGLWQADTLYIGASFTRNSYDPVSVWLMQNDAGWQGSLYFVAPKTGEEVFLFTNKGTTNVRTVISDKYDIPVGDTVYFIYKVTTTGASANSRLPKYTGPNIPNVSRYWSLAGGGPYGNRWSVAGRVNDSIVQFGFEDNVDKGSDMDFNDIIFGTTLSLASDPVPARLYFTDKAGTVLTNGSYYSPGNDSIYITYIDDYGNGGLAKDIVFNVVNRKGAAAQDLETITVTPSSHIGSVGTWTAKIPIEEAGGKPGDKKIQTYFLGEVTATVKTHNQYLLPDGNSVTANIKVAYPDKPESVKLGNCNDSAANIDRTTTCVKVTVVDQNFTRNSPDTVWSEVKCELSGDVIGRVPLIEQPNGTYVSGNIVKNEAATPSSADPILSCKSTDNIIVTYSDEVYNNPPVTYKAPFSINGEESFHFVKTTDLTNVLAEIKDGDDSNFVALIKAPTPNVGVVDIIDVTLTSSQGDVEVFKATETGPNSGVFSVVIPFDFLTTAPISGSHTVDGYLDPTQVVTGVTVNGVTAVSGKTYTASIILRPALNLVKNAYIKDENGDGRGDKVYIVFTRPLETLPATLSPTYWNQTSSAVNTAPPVISFLPGSTTVVVADFSGAPFPKGLTSIPAGQRPFVTLPDNNVFGAQKPAIADSMGPIITAATINPFNSLNLIAGATTELNVDTIVVSISEALKTKTEWTDLLRFSKPVNGACTDYAHSSPVIPYGQPKDNGNGTWTILVGSGVGASPLALDCVYLNVNGIYTDINGNLPPIHGEQLQGKRPPKEIEVFRGYPPVAGLDANKPGFIVSNNDAQTGTGGEYSKNTGTGFQTVWVAPADLLIVNGTVIQRPIPNIDAPVVQGQDKGVQTAMPAGISTVQVVSTGEYIATVAIFDNLGNFVKTFKQAFGYLGELNNQERAAKRGLVSYLVWDMKNSTGQKAGQGVYVWKVVFQFKTGKQEIRYTRTGLMRDMASNP